MKAIKQRLGIFVAASSMGLLTSLLLFLENASMHGIYYSISFAMVLLCTASLIIFLIREIGRYKTAKLIVDNKIMHIQAVKVEHIIGKVNIPMMYRDIEVFISCFGILLDSRIIEFNASKVKLKAIEIRRELIYLSYGTEEITKKIWILHGTISTQELQSYKDRFSYETGIVPMTIDL